MPRDNRQKVASKKAGRSRTKGPQAKRKEAAEHSEVTLGPIRRRRTKLQSARLTSHKARSRWFQTRASWPVREAPVNKIGK